jgi:hypothetical protein
MKSNSNLFVVILLIVVIVLNIVILIMEVNETGKPVPPPAVLSTPISTQNLSATATAACQQFHSQYPATPCP